MASRARGALVLTFPGGPGATCGLQGSDTLRISTPDPCSAVADTKAFTVNTAAKQLDVAMV